MEFNLIILFVGFVVGSRIIGGAIYSGLACVADTIKDNHEQTNTRYNMPRADKCSKGSVLAFCRERVRGSWV
ncbi:hypothetical protein [Lentilitoribacter sp. EG35]|uniref:hypothetical protein n=1 Tax=Lentilitoribacter sp. EG35 TaxID=3234192 RepID=UPI00345FDDAC